MAAAAATQASPRTPWSPAQGRPLSSTTAAGVTSAKTPGVTGAGGKGAGASTTGTLTSPARGPVVPSTPNYFEYISDPDANPPNSNAGGYAKRNWSPQSGSDGPKTAESYVFQPLDSQTRFENFRRQSEGTTFKLSQGSLSQTHGARRDSNGPGAGETGFFGADRSNIGWEASPQPLDGQDSRRDSVDVDPMELDPPDEPNNRPRATVPTRPNILGATRSISNGLDMNLSQIPRSQLSRIDERHPRNSLPHNRVDILQPPIQRSETLPVSLKTDGPEFVPPQALDQLLERYGVPDILLLDLRVSHQYNKSRIYGAMNLCIPTTLLKRASFNVARLSASLSKSADREKFDTWRESKAVVVYDAGAFQMSDAASCVNILKKFIQEQFQGATYLIRGGFNSFSKACPSQVDQRPAHEMDSASTTPGLSIDPPTAAPVIGGCEIPSDQTAANPFFGNIRQNMDLIGGVGQMSVTIPAKLKQKHKSGNLLPKWLQAVSEADDQGKMASERFLRIEKEEEHRMKKALSVRVSYGSPDLMSPDKVQVAGIEKGLKNRYKDILPYDHSRVRLQNVPSGACDYVNASHIQAEGCRKRYIASQAPVPATFADFWRVAWEQDVRVIVMLTAESEGGNLKCHPYWLPGEYGNFKLKSLSERTASLERRRKNPTNRSFTAPIHVPQIPKDTGKPPMSRRHSSKHSISSSPSASSASSQAPPPLPPTDDSETPHVIIRKLALSNTSNPFEPLREITQLQFSTWPDFGAPTHPAQVLSLVERCNDAVRSYERPSDASSGPETESRPVVVHCSAGCGRTGTFCTIDSVIDMLKRQRAYRRRRQQQDQPVTKDKHHKHHQRQSSSVSKSRPTPGRSPHSGIKESGMLRKEDLGVHDAIDVDGVGGVASTMKGVGRDQGKADDMTVEPSQEDVPSWLDHDDIDLVARTVASFRLQRLSMVQTLRQFVLCYESILEWMSMEMEGQGDDELGVEGETWWTR